jgi:hypothetical protein
MVQTAYPLLTTVGERKITVNGQTISYLIKRSSRAKHVRLEVRQETGLTVVIPSSYRIKQLPVLLESKGSWILDKLTKYGQVQSVPDKKEIKSGDTIPYLGRDLEVVKQQNHRNTNSIKLERNRLVVSIGSASSRLNLILEQWYRLQAAKLIKERVDKLSARLGLTYNRIIIRGQKTRWGSCSYKGNLSFNWKLIMAPEPVIDYVVIHEIAHLKEMNHTKRFWELVAEHCPRWREHRKWLKDHEKELADKLSR